MKKSCIFVMSERQSNHNHNKKITIMKTLKLTSAQQKIKTQSGSIYVKMNSFYTATVRSLSSFVEYINNNKEEIEEMEILNVSEVSPEFLKAVKQIISSFNSEEQEEKLIENVEMIHVEGHSFTMDVIVRADGKVKLLFDTFGNEWRQCFQTVKESGKGYFVTLYKSRVYFNYFFPKF